MYNTTAESKIKKTFFSFLNYHQELVPGKRGFVLMQTLVFFNKKAKRSSMCGCCSQTPYSSQTLYSYSTVTMNTGCYCFGQTQEDQVCGVFLSTSKWIILIYF